MTTVLNEKIHLAMLQYDFQLTFVVIKRTYREISSYEQHFAKL